MGGGRGGRGSGGKGSRCGQGSPHADALPTSWPPVWLKGQVNVMFTSSRYFLGVIFFFCADLRYRNSPRFISFSSCTLFFSPSFPHLECPIPYALLSPVTAKSAAGPRTAAGSQPSAPRHVASLPAARLRLPAKNSRGRARPTSGGRWCSDEDSSSPWLPPAWPPVLVGTATRGSKSYPGSLRKDDASRRNYQKVGEPQN